MFSGRKQQQRRWKPRGNCLRADLEYDPRKIIEVISSIFTERTPEFIVCRIHESISEVTSKIISKVVSKIIS
jgi:hypothetical protein